jgi:hypothetical protein
MTRLSIRTDLAGKLGRAEFSAIVHARMDMEREA